MLRSLYARLAFVLFGLFCVIGGAFLVAALYSAQMYQQEVAQRLNRNLAMYVVDEHVLIGEHGVNQPELEDLFHNMMIINPSLEMYLLGPQGEIIGHVNLPIAGLMSNERAEVVSRKAASVLYGFRACGCQLNNPNMQLSLLALVVIPELRISDLGLVDVTSHSIVPLEERVG